MVKLRPIQGHQGPMSVSASFLTLLTMRTGLDSWRDLKSRNCNKDKLERRHPGLIDSR